MSSLRYLLQSQQSHHSSRYAYPNPIPPLLLLVHRLLNAIRLDRLPICILHLRVLRLLYGFGGGLFRILGALLGVRLCLSLRRGFFLSFDDGLSLGLDLVLVALDDGPRHEADLVHLGDVGGFGGVFAVLVEPVLEADD